MLRLAPSLGCCNQLWLYSGNTRQFLNALAKVKSSTSPAKAEFRHSLTHRLAKRADHSVGGFVVQTWRSDTFDAMSLGTAGEILRAPVGKWASTPLRK
jgi:hypothetical protein